MTIQKKHGLTHSVGNLEDGLKNNIDMMGHEDPAVRMTARLNRDLVAVVDSFLAAEGKLSRDTFPDFMRATTHGVVTVCGTLLVNTPPSKRAEVHKAMREHLLKVFDAMGKNILER